MYLIFNVSYLFAVLWLVVLILFNFMCVFNFFSHLKFLVILVYMSGVVVFILYIPCLCWHSPVHISKFFLCFTVVTFMMVDYGSHTLFTDLGAFFYMFMFFSFLFGVLVTYYSLYLFKSSGSSRI